VLACPSHTSSSSLLPALTPPTRSFLKAEEADFSALSEYSEFADVTRARARFYQRHTRLLLYTERAHFYHRYCIRGIQVWWCLRAADVSTPACSPAGIALAAPCVLTSCVSTSHHTSCLLQDIVFYGLPDHAHFYAELVNLVQTGGAAAGGHHATITSLFCAFDALALGRVVGASRAAKMLTPGSSPTFVFC
jgi:U3 small nucleolar RNA-associated protein 25